MKTIKYICLLLITLGVVTACNDGLPDELFEKKVILTNNGWLEQSVELTQSGIIEIPFTVSISGTSDNEKPVTVGMMFDSTYLSTYNFEKYRNQNALYYTQIPVEAISFESENLTIEKKANRAISSLRLDMNKVTDKYLDYVVPVAIKSVSDYTPGGSLYTKALCHLEFKNSFSGNYSADIRVFQTNNNGSNDSLYVTVGSKTLYAISDRACYFFAGTLDRTKTDRMEYIVELSINDSGEIELTSPNPDLGLIQESASIETNYTVNNTDNRYLIANTTLDLVYVFNDNPSASKPKKLRTQGRMYLTQSVLKDKLILN